MRLQKQVLHAAIRLFKHKGFLLIQMQLNHSLKIGFSFGFTSGIITTLGLMVGLYAGTMSELAVLGGIITIAIADAFSDSLGVHVSEEAECVHSSKEIWQSTVSTFLTKFFVAILFIVPLLVFDLATAVNVSIVLGLSLLGIFSFFVARERNASPLVAVAEHLIIGIAVIAATFFVGEWIRLAFV